MKDVRSNDTIKKEIDLKRAILELDIRFIEDIFKQNGTLENICNITIIENGLPDDAKIIDVRLSFFNRKLELLFESEEFEDINVGDEYPTLAPPTLGYDKK